MKTAIVWFKTDLRIRDNETLLKAISNNDQIIPVYCFDPAHFTKTSFGFKKTGGFRGKFLLEALKDLDKQLRALGSGLIILKGQPEIELPKLAKAYRAHKVYAKREVAFEEKRTEELTQAALWKIPCEFETFSTSTLYHAVDLPFSIRNIPDVFTSFRKKTEIDGVIRAELASPEQITSPTIPKFELPTLEELGLKKTKQDSRSAFPFIGGQTAAEERMNYYFYGESKLIRNYKETRNGLVGQDYSSKFSPWLSLGCISPRTIYHTLKEHEAQFGANDSTYWLIFELLWRDYFRFMMKKYPNRYFLKNGIQYENADDNPIDQNLLDKWINGKTGVDFVDANMIELKLTGFMSNRGRQNVASYLCNDLKLDWRYGASYFEEALIDYDVCSNWGNWAYLAGVGNDPRANRYFNIEKQANDYDKNGDYRRTWLK